MKPLATVIGALIATALALGTWLTRTRVHHFQPRSRRWSCLGCGVPNEAALAARAPA